MAGDLEATIDHASSPSCADGRIEVNPLNGIPPFTYSWYNFNDPSQIIGTGNSIDNLLPGKYCVDVEDAYGGEVCGCWDVGINNTLIRLIDLVNANYCTETGGMCKLSNGGIIEVDIVTTKGYYIRWSNGMTTKKITNLAPGNYYLSVFLNGGCVIQQKYEICCCDIEVENNSANLCKLCDIDNATPIEIIKYSHKNASYPAYSDGSISLDLILGDYKYIIWSGPNNFYSNALKISNLILGTYCVKIGNGCVNVEKCFEVSKCSLFDLQTLAYVSYTCPGEKSGIIAYSNPNCIYKWEDGSSSNSRINLGIGTYRVTISDPSNSGCVVSEEHKIEELPRVNAELDESKPDCNNMGVGRLYLNLTNFNYNSPFQKYWEDQKDVPFNYSRERLKAGTYCVVLEDYCGVVRKCFDVEGKNLTSNFSTTWRCENNRMLGNIVLNSSNNHSETYKWSNGATTKDLLNVPLGDYKVTVSSPPCESVLSIKLDPIELLMLEQPCQGFDDGRLALRINNPNNSYITVKYKFAICEDCFYVEKIPKTNENPILINFDKLDGKDVIFIVNIDGCEIERIVKIGTKPLNDKFSKFDDTNGDCVYDLYCKSTFISKDSKFEKPTLVPLPCKNEVCPSVEIYCRDNILVKTIKPEKIHVRKEKARAIAAALNKLAEFDALYGWVSPCSFIDICSTDPSCSKDNWIPHGDISQGGDFVGYDTEGNCIIVKCRYAFFLTIRIKICGNSYMPDDMEKYLKPSNSYINLHIGNHESGDDDGEKYLCKEYRTESWYVIKNNIGFYRAKYGDKKVDLFLETIKKLGIKVDENTSSSYCATVTYCLDNFEFLRTDYNDLNCGSLPSGLVIRTNSGFQFKTVCQYVIGDNGRIYVLCDQCPNEPDPCYEIIEIPTGPKTPFQLDQSDVLQSYLLPYEYVNHKFENLSYYYSEDSLILVNGIISKNGRNIQMLRHPLQNYISHNVDSTELLLDIYHDPINQSTIKTLLTADKLELKFLNTNEDQISSFKFKSLPGVNFHKLIYRPFGFIQPISYNNNLFINDSLVCESKSTGFTLASYYTNSNLFELLNFENVRYLPTKGKREELIFVNAVNLDQPIKVNNVAYSNNDGKLIVYNAESDKMDGINFSLNNYNICDYSSSNGSTYIAMVGDGMFAYGDSIYNPIFDKSLLIVRVEKGSVKGIFEQNATDILEKTVNLESNQKGSLIVGYSIRHLGSTNTVDHNIEIKNYNSNLEFINSYNYGSLNSEILSELLLTNDDLVYIGGDIYGTHDVSIIGNVELTQILESESDPFISYLNLKEFANTSTVRSKDEKAQDKYFMIYPNPTKSNLTLQSIIDKGGNYSYTLYNSIGQKLRSENFSLEKSQNLVELKLSQLPSGIYFIMIEREDQILQFEKIIIL
jgi:hypothetical protein